MRQSGDRFQQPAGVEDLRGFDKESNTVPAVDGAPLAKYGDVWKVAPGSVNFFEAEAITAVTAMRGVVIADGGVEHRKDAGTDSRGFVGVAASNTLIGEYTTVLQVCDVAPDKHNLDGSKTVYMDAKGMLTTVLKDSEKTAIGYTDARRVLYLRMSGAGSGSGGGGALEVMAAGLSKGTANILDFANAAVSVTDGKATITTEGGGGGGGTGAAGPAAMVNFDGSIYPDILIRDSYNVRSVNRLGAGHYEINFASAFPTEKYYAVCSFCRTTDLNGTGGYGMGVNVVLREKGRVVILCQFYNGGQYDFDYISVVVLTGPIISTGGEVTVAASGVVKGPVTQINFANSDVSYVGKIATITTRPNAVDPAPGDGVASLPVGYVSYQPWTGKIVTNGGDVWLRMTSGEKVDFGLYPELNKAPNIFDIKSDIPAMTKATTGVWTASASSSVPNDGTGAGQPWSAFAGTSYPTTGYEFWQSAVGSVNANTGVCNQWLQIAKTTAFRIYGYGVAGYERNEVPVEWEFLASDNGATWVILDSQIADGTLINLNYSGYTFYFPVQTIKAYRYYRVRVTKTNVYGYTNALLTKLVLWGDDVKFKPVGYDANGWWPYVKAKNGTLVGGGGGGGGDTATELEVFSKGVSQGVVDKLDFLTADIEVVEKKAAISEASSLGDGTLTVVPVGFTSPQPWTASVVANDTETWVRLDGSPVDPKEYPELADNRNVIVPINAVPIMKSATQDGFTVTQRSMNSATYAGWKAFDGLSAAVANIYLTSPSSLNAVGDVITEEWIRISRAEPFKISGYGMVPLKAYNPPTAWVFEGSNDGLSWETLDAQGGIDLTLVKKEYYTFRTEAEYRHYRIFFISAKLVTTTKYLGLAELILCGDSFVFADLGKDENDFYYYAKAKSTGSTGPVPDPTASTVVVAEAGIAKGPASTINFNGANIDVSNKQANVNFVISSQGGNGYPVGFTGYYPWTARVIISDAGVWIRQDGGPVDLAQYPQLKDSLSILDLVTTVPVMTANTGGGWTASASTIYGPTYQAFNAFDGSEYFENAWVSAPGTLDMTTGKIPNSWLQISKNVAFTVYGYGFMSNNHVAYDAIKSWKFMGSTNGSTWVTLDTQLNYDYPVHDVLDNFLLPAPATYRFFRIQPLDVDVPRGRADYIAINTLNLWSNIVNIKAVPKNEKGYFQYVKVQAGPYEAGGTTPAADIDVYEKGTLKGRINKINFVSSIVDVTDKTAVVTNESSGGGGSGGGGIPCGYVSQQPWDGMVHTDESGTWLNMSAGGQETSFATYPGLAAGAATLYVNSCVPNITANTSGVWTASASSISAPHPAWMAFGVDSGGWHSALNTVNATTGVCNQWVQITKTTPFKIYGYYFSGQNSGFYNGIWSWSFLGSVDGAKWDVLDTHTKYEPCIHDRRVYFAIDTPILYKAYRLNITSMKPNTLGYDSGNKTLCSITNLALYDAPVSLPGYGLGNFSWPLFVKAAHPQGGG